MRDNFNISIIGKRVKLVPYQKKFVEAYNQWMKDPYLLDMTASEPLSIEEEYEMQRSWQEDANKCTFIILINKELKQEINSTGSINIANLASNEIYDNFASNIDSNLVDEEISLMVGDVNLFLNDHDDKSIAELEIMIANNSYRNYGLGTHLSIYSSIFICTLIQLLHLLVRLINDYEYV